MCQIPRVGEGEGVVPTPPRHCFYIENLKKTRMRCYLLLIILTTLLVFLLFRCSTHHEYPVILKMAWLCRVTVFGLFLIRGGQNHGRDTPVLLFYQEERAASPSPPPSPSHTTPAPHPPKGGTAVQMREVLYLQQRWL